MIKNKKYGFTLTEMMVALLIVSLVLAAVIPTVTKKRATESNNLWKSEYVGLGDTFRNIYSEQIMDDNAGLVLGIIGTAIGVLGFICIVVCAAAVATATV